MAKHSKVNLGEIEAILNIIGGESALNIILSDSNLASRVSEAVKSLIDSTGIYLVPLYPTNASIMLPATKGTVTLADSAAIFDGGLDSNLVNWNTNKKGRNTKPQGMRVLEQSRDCKFRQMFESLGSLDQSCMSQGQIVSFCSEHRDKLRQEGWGTFFLFKVGSEYFVAHVRVDGDGRLHLRVNRIDSSNVWYGRYRHRVVVPQLYT